MRWPASLAAALLLLASPGASAVETSTEGKFEEVPSTGLSYYTALGVTSCSDQANATNRITLRFDEVGGVDGDFEVRIEGSTTCDAFDRCEVVAAMTGRLDGAFDRATRTYEGTFEASVRLDVVVGCEGEAATMNVPLAGVGDVDPGTDIPVKRAWSAAVEGETLRGSLSPEPPGSSLAFEAPGEGITTPSTSTTTEPTEGEDREAAPVASEGDGGGGSNTGLLLVVAGLVLTGLGAWWTAAARRRRTPAATASSG